jgi:hypothetical protein
MGVRFSRGIYQGYEEADGIEPMRRCASSYCTSTVFT